MTFHKIGSIVVLSLVLLSFTNLTMGLQNRKEQREVTLRNDSLLRHVVLFKFKEGTPDGALQDIENAFGRLPEKIPQIHSYEWGLNNSPEALNKGFTHCFLVTFKSEEDRAIYLPHPAHLALIDLLKPSVEDVLVVDYWAE